MFDFGIVDFPLISSNITSGSSSGIYVYHLIRYFCCCPSYDNFYHLRSIGVEAAVSYLYNICEHLQEKGPNC